MAEPDERPVALEELLVSSLAQTDALAKLLIEKGLIMQRISEERATYLTNPNLVDRQREYKPASLTDFALYPDPSTMQLNKLLGQG